MPLPTIDATDSALRAFSAEGGSAEDVAAEMVSGSGIDPASTARVVVIVGNDEGGEDEEITCQGAQRAVKVVVARVHELVGW